VCSSDLTEQIALATGLSVAEIEALRK
jgi:hypothetical protein